MRQHRRVSFAAPFVMVVTAACGSSPRHEPIHDNPPPPQTPEKAPEKPTDKPTEKPDDPPTSPVALDVDHCKALVDGASCATEGESCHITDGCGVMGYRCEAGAWKRLMKYCNPPPPKR